MPKPHIQGQFGVDNCPFCGSEHIDYDSEYTSLDTVERTIRFEHHFNCETCDEHIIQTLVFNLGDCLQDTIE